VTPIADLDSLLSIPQVAKRLSVTEACVRKWLAQRRLPRVKLGKLTRLRTLDVDKIIREGLPAPGTYPRELVVVNPQPVLLVPQSQLDRAG